MSKFSPLVPLLAAGLVLSAAATDSFTAWSPRPPMGWNSYDAYHGSVTEAQIRAVTGFMADRMKPLGWEYVVVDFLWFHPGPPGWDPSPKKWHAFEVQQKPGRDGKMAPRMIHDEWGRPLPAVNRFPSAANGAGFKPLADHVHAQGLKFGIHLMRGIPAQVVEDNLPIKGTPYHARDIAEPEDVSSFLRGMWHGVDHTKPGAQEYYDSLFALYASWGVDFIKADDMLVPPYHAKEIEMMRRAIDRSGRPMVLSLSYGEAPMSQAAHLRDNANMWRVSADFWDEWKDLLHLFDLMNAWSPFIGQNNTWPDADMIPLGRLCLRGYPGSVSERKEERDSRFTTEEQYALMSLWCIARSPLMWGGDPLSSSPQALALLTNPEVIAVNQQSSGNRQIWSRPNQPKANQRIWVADIPGSADKYFALFNLTDKEAEVPFDFELEYWRSRYRVRDLWQRVDLGEFSRSFTAHIGAHGGRLYRLTPLP